MSETLKVKPSRKNSIYGIILSPVFLITGIVFISNSLAMFGVVFMIFALIAGTALVTTFLAELEIKEGKVKFMHPFTRWEIEISSLTAIKIEKIKRTSEKTRYTAEFIADNSKKYQLLDIEKYEKSDIDKVFSKIKAINPKVEIRTESGRNSLSFETETKEGYQK